jgi:hypothetical protein
MTLDQTKLKELDAKLSKEVTPHPQVPAYMYARAEMKEHEGVLVPTFTRVRTKTLKKLFTEVDETVDKVCNGTDEPWILKEVYPLHEKGTGTWVMLLFLCVDEIVLPTLDTPTAPVDEDTEARAKEWQNASA